MKNKTSLEWYYKMIIGIIILLIISFFISCDITKSSVKSKSDTTIKDELETKTYRKGDSVSFRPGVIKYKDTTIYRVSKENTTLRTVYDSNGNIRDIDCYASQIEELTRRNLVLEQSQKNKASEKTEKFDSSFILYLVIGIVVIVIAGIIIIIKKIAVLK